MPINYGGLGQGYNSPISVISKSLTFTGAATLGQAGTSATVFTITGQVLLRYIVAVCTVTLTGATSQIALKGAEGYTYVAATLATDIAAGDTWIDATPDETLTAAVPATMKDLVLNGDGGSKTIIVNSTVADTTGGTLRFYMVYMPLSTNAAVA